MPAGSKKRKQAKKGHPASHHRKQQQQQQQHDADRSRDSSPSPSPGRSSDGNGPRPTDFDNGGGHSSEEDAATTSAAAAASVPSSSAPANPSEEPAVMSAKAQEEENNEMADSTCDYDDLRVLSAETCHSLTENVRDDCCGEEEAESSLISANDSAEDILTLPMAAEAAQREVDNGKTLTPAQREEEEEESPLISVKDPEIKASEDAALATKAEKEDDDKTLDYAERSTENNLGNRGEKEEESSLIPAKDAESLTLAIGDAAMATETGNEEDNKETVVSSSLASVNDPAETLNLGFKDADMATEVEEEYDLGGSLPVDRLHLSKESDLEEILTVATVSDAQKEKGDDGEVEDASCSEGLHISMENNEEEFLSSLISVNSSAEETLTLATEIPAMAVDSNGEDDGIQQKGLFPSVSALEGEIPCSPSGLITSVISDMEQKEIEAAEAMNFTELIDSLSAEKLALPEENTLEGVIFSDISREDDNGTVKEQLLPTVSALEGEIPGSSSSLDNTQLITSAISESEKKENEANAVVINELIDSLSAEKSPVLEEENTYEWEILDISAVEEADKSSVGELPLPLDLTAEGENSKKFPSDLMEGDKELLSDLAAAEGELLSELVEKGQILSDLSAKGSFLLNSSARNSNSNTGDCDGMEVDSKKPLDSVDSFEGTKNELISSSSDSSVRNSDSNKWEYDESEITSKKLLASSFSIEKSLCFSDISVKHELIASSPDNSVRNSDNNKGEDYDEIATSKSSEKLIDSSFSIEKLPSLSKISVEGTKNELIAFSLVDTVTDSGHNSLLKDKEDGDIVNFLNHSRKEHRNANLQEEGKEEASLDDIVDTIVEESFVPMSEMTKVEERGEEEGIKKKGTSVFENSVNNDGSEGSLMEPTMEPIPEEIVHVAAQKALIDGNIISKEELERKKSSPLKDSTTARAAQSRSPSGGKEEDEKKTDSWEFLECSVMPTYSEVASDARSPSSISSSKEIVQGNGNYRREVGGFARLKGCCGVIDWLAGRRG